MFESPNVFFFQQTIFKLEILLRTRSKKISGEICFYSDKKKHNEDFKMHAEVAWYKDLQQ